MRYEYVHVESGGNFMFASNNFEHRKIIDEYAKMGYRFVCCIPTATAGYGKMTSIDLVFEIDED